MTKNYEQMWKELKEELQELTQGAMLCGKVDSSKAYDNVLDLILTKEEETSIEV